jgi:hypothetical protein
MPPWCYYDVCSEMEPSYFSRRRLLFLPAIQRLRGDWGSKFARKKRAWNPVDDGVGGPFSKLCRSKPQTSACQQRFHKRGIRSRKAPRYMHNLSPFVAEKARTFQDAGYLVQSDRKVGNLWLI